MGIRAKLTVGAALCALTLAAAQPAFATPGPTATATATSTPTGAVTHATSSACADATVLTPQAGTVTTAQSMGMTAGAEGFYARAAASHATWLSTMSCTKTGRTHALRPADAGAATGDSATSAPVTRSGIGGGFNAGSGALIQSGTAGRRRERHDLLLRLVRDRRRHPRHRRRFL